MINNKLHQVVFDSLMEEASVFFVIANRQGVIVHANQFATQLTGDSLINKTFESIVVDLSNSFNWSNLINSGNRRVMLNIVTWLGLPETLRFSFFPVDEQIVVVASPDYLEFENLRKQLVILNSESNNLNRTVQKQNYELSELNKMKDLFLGMAAHDLRNPLNVIMNYAEFLLYAREKNLPDDQTTFINTILTSADYMAHIINDFLDIAISNSGNLSLVLCVEEMVTLIYDALEISRIKAVKRNIEVEFNAPDKVVVTCDGNKIKQAVINLTTNAIQHSSDNGKVTVTLSKKDDSIQVSISDNGAGMDTEQLDNLYKPYKRKKTKITNEERSIGLGLVITKKIIEAHKGKIWVESVINCGTTFYFSIPCNLIGL